MTVLRQKALNLLENIPDDYIEDVINLLENFQFTKNIMKQKTKKMIAYELMENMKKKSHFPKDFKKTDGNSRLLVSEMKVRYFFEKIIKNILTN